MFHNVCQSHWRASQILIRTSVFTFPLWDNYANDTQPSDASFSLKFLSYSCPDLWEDVTISCMRFPSCYKFSKTSLTIFFLSSLHNICSAISLLQFLEILCCFLRKIWGIIFCSFSCGYPSSGVGLVSMQLKQFAFQSTDLREGRDDCDGRGGCLGAFSESSQACRDPFR